MALLLAHSAALAEKRIALLIGNQDYDASVGKLKNPHNDIAVVGEALTGQVVRTHSPDQGRQPKRYPRGRT